EGRPFADRDDVPDVVAAGPEGPQGVENGSPEGKESDGRYASEVEDHAAGVTILFEHEGRRDEGEKRDEVSLEGRPESPARLQHAARLVDVLPLEEGEPQKDDERDQGRIPGELGYTLRRCDETRVKAKPVRKEPARNDDQDVNGSKEEAKALVIAFQHDESFRMTRGSSLSV